MDSSVQQAGRHYLVPRQSYVLLPRGQEPPASSLLTSKFRQADRTTVYTQLLFSPGPDPGWHLWVLRGVPSSDKALNILNSLNPGSHIRQLGLDSQTPCRPVYRCSGQILGKNSGLGCMRQSAKMKNGFFLLFRESYSLKII